MDGDLVKRLKEVDSIVKGLTSEIREAAFVFLQPYIVGAEVTPLSRVAPAAPGPATATTPADNPDTGNIEDFFTVHRDSGDPADNVRAITAYLYKEYGIEPFSLQEIKDIATEVGITIPGRVDMTLKGARKSGKQLYLTAGRGKYRPTVTGEQVLKEDFKVTKGTKKRPTDSK